ncbi:30S ribosomal protein S20 [Candidatus Saccharibacteria bacterium]|nr:30S ribosomal protein S20 [Candidatus Saccharibacteria bacterium]
MPIIKSAKKRVRVAQKAAVRNSKTKRSMRSAIKAFHANITGSNADSVQSALDQAVKKGVIHKNKAARKKKQIANLSKNTELKTATKKTATKKTATKKSTK